MNRSDVPTVNCTLEKSPYLAEQYWLIGVFGSSVCVIGTVFNTALSLVLFRREFRATYLIYLAVLALMDIGVLLTYLFVMVGAVLYELYDSPWLSGVWHAYVRYFYTLSRIVTLASTYLVLACSLERYLEVLELRTSRAGRMPPKRTRYIVVASVVCVVVLFRLVVLFELRVDERPECLGTLAHFSLNRTELTSDYFYAKVYSFWIVHVVQVFFPFPALVLLNVLIALAWRGLLASAADSKRQRLFAQSRSARKTMVAVVSSYLACNLLHFTLTCWEHVGRHFLDRHQKFYTLASDTVTLLTAVNASFRLPIYYVTNGSIRTTFDRLLSRCTSSPDYKTSAGGVANQKELEIGVPLLGGPTS